ncbi:MULTISPECIES: YiiX/YebB-like N1pC/P60 family cysteine hydrolase [Cytobacillus]|jgi:uncharacterized protein YycO|uniref:YycO n=1 Tax=Cytobacillus oceanisediminis 2691 TaxID=1196031 RepID=A0A160M781_9BACI|nr:MULTISPECIES: YiiX/YebB-like N1pC/P60 family cysteine hydrolase [Cytobacillus]MBY0156688.1 hypothetical protein [Cytobacillus firmus]AND38337.1 hypothetical protein A361_04125 [Cytobacillus oceanisediminis 2691]MCM3242102.1 hypothetical protein [Cytobacillus oceanisediminis]MCM3391187.1 hypothetical protein [Cytobacillus oceanisediminis]MCM3531442.1 hypothetical protein [Cytobacillus oceanisediminis]
MKKSKKALVALAVTLGLSLSFSPSSFAKSSEISTYLKEIVKLQPGTTEKEILESVTEYAKSQKLSKDEVIKMVHSELIRDKEEGDKVAKENGNDKENIVIFGGSAGSYTLPMSSKGNIYYTDSYTAYYNHGHVGMYSTSDKIVEAVPGDGVRQIKYNGRNVEKNSIIQKVNVTSTQKSNAADWAVSQVGDSYSFNFATNRLTGHDGDKNCSKLLWSAFTLKANIDIDNNGGLGVYPRDITASSYTSTIATIN